MCRAVSAQIRKGLGEEMGFNFGMLLLWHYLADLISFCISTDKHTHAEELL